jgi:hypothetical protein
MAARSFVFCLLLHLAGVLAPPSASALSERFAAPFHAYLVGPAGGTTGGVAADFNRDGRLDVVTIGSRDLVGSAWILYGGANATFLPPSPITSSLVWPRAVAAADMNGDGLLDLVVARSVYAGSPGVQIVLQNGTTWTTLPLNTVTNDPMDIATADLNHDGAVDVVVANQDANNISVFLGNGDGTLRAHVDYATGTAPKALAIGDLNSDGQADVVTANSTGTGVTIWYGTGTGTLASRNDVATASTEPWDVVIGRFNADAIPDIATVHLIDSKISILLGLGGTSYAAPTSVTPAFGTNLVTEDFNSDGKTDLAFIAGGTGGVVLGTGTGTFGAPISFKAGGVIAFMAGRLHGDLNPDLLAVDPGGALSVLSGNGDGKFGTDKETSAGSGPNAIVVGDVTGDGKPDAIVSDPYAPAIVVVPGDATWTSPGPPTSYAAAGGPVNSLGLADLDGDGDLDVVAGIQASPPNNVEVFYNNGSGAFSTHATYSAPAGSNPRAVVARDCNGDNRPDLFVANGSSAGTGSFSVFLNDGFGGFLSPTTYSVAFSEIVAIVPTNIVGTSAIDLVLADHSGNRVFIYSGNGTGAFSLSKVLSTPAYPVSVSTGDLSDDGLSDIAVLCDNSNEVGIYINSVTNTFTNTDNIFVGYLGFNPGFILGSDLDGDGMRDLVVSNPILNTITFLRRTSSTPTFAPAEPLGVGFNPAWIAVADLDSDADQDILVANSQQPSIQILKNTGPVTPPDLAPTVLTVPSVNVEATGTLTFTVAASDGNGDAISSLGAAPLPTGAVFTPDADGNTSGVFTWTPTTSQVGSYTITFTASNTLSGSAKTTIHVDAYGTQANGTFLWVPQIADIGTHTIRFRAANTRGDPAVTESTVITVSPPSAMALERMAGRLILSPERSMKGPVISIAHSYSATVGDTVAVDVSASDTDSLTANTTGTSGTFSNDLDPVVHAPPHVNAPRGVPLSFTVTASDPNGDAITSLTANLSSLPPGSDAHFTPGAGNTSGVFTWTPAMTDSGIFGVTFTSTNELVGVGATEIHVYPTGPVSYWKLNGNGRDEIGKVNLNPVGTPVYAAGKFNQGIVLDGTGVNGLQATATADQNVQGSRTVECWVNAGANQAQDRILLATQDSPGDNYWLIGVTALGQAWVQVYQDGTYTSDMRSTTVITGGAFHHIAFTTDGTTLTFYVDGVVQTTSTQMAACTVAGGTIAVGAGILPARSGTVDEIRVWNVALTQAQIQATMNSELTGYVTAVEGPSPPVYRNVLRQNAPNPFNPHTEIAFELARAGRTALRIYDARGRLVSTLLDATLPAGPHRATWDGTTDLSGRDVASGVYFYRLDAPGFHESRRMVLTR